MNFSGLRNVDRINVLKDIKLSILKEQVERPAFFIYVS